MLWLTLDKDSSVPMIRQVFGQIRQRILDGELPEGTRLPSIRRLSGHLRISRYVILEADDLLFAEGFTELKTDSGTCIAPGIHAPVTSPTSTPEVESVPMGNKSGTRLPIFSGRAMPRRLIKWLWY